VAIATSLACAGSLDQPGRFGYLNAPPDAGGGTPGDTQSDAGCDPVTDIFPPNCTTGACHSAQAQQGGLDLESAGMPQRLVDKKAKGGPGMLIDSKSPDQSVLYLKLTDSPPFQFQMPLGAAPLSRDELSCVQAWIDAAVAQ
jgi:hypothetical protein